LQQNEIRPGPKRNDRAVDVDMDGLIASGTLFTSSNSDEVARKSQPKAAPPTRVKLAAMRIWLCVYESTR
jgi:hypothetical protein